MSDNPGFLARIRTKIRKRLVSGIFILVPAVITFLVLKGIFGLITHNLSPIIRGLLGPLPEPVVVVLSVIVLILFVYLLGLLGSRIAGRQALARLEQLLDYIPLVRQLYRTSKQVVEALASSNSNQGFQSVVLVDFPHPGSKAVAFKTGSMIADNGDEYWRVMIPTSPNPTSGFLTFVPVKDIHETDLTLEEGMKIIISGGILSSSKLRIPAKVDEKSDNGPKTVN